MQIRYSQLYYIRENNLGNFKVAPNPLNTNFASLTILRKVLRKVEIITNSRSGDPNFEFY